MAFKSQMWVIKRYEERDLIFMVYNWTYKTHLGFDDIMMTSDGEFLTGLWFVNSSDDLKHSFKGNSKFLPIFKDTCKWLDVYFSGRNPDFMVKYKISGLTDFRKDVIYEMLKIPFGKVTTYGDIAKSIALKRGIKKMSSQAVGGAVGWNPICIIIPCHRVIGAFSKLTGYGGGLNNKLALLKNEGIDV